MIPTQTGESTLTRRPASIWAALGLFAIYIPMLTLVSFVPYERSVLDEIELADEIIYQTENVLIIASFVLAFVAIWKRKRWGRWFLVAPIVYLIGSTGFRDIFYPGPPVQKGEYSEDLWIVLAVVLATPLFTFLLVSVGDSVKKYFSADTNSA